MIRATDIVGYSYGGALYCVTHKPQVEEEDLAPVFASEVAADEDLETCDTCGESLFGKPDDTQDPDRGYKEARDERALEEE